MRDGKVAWEDLYARGLMVAEKKKGGRKKAAETGLDDLIRQKEGKEGVVVATETAVAVREKDEFHSDPDRREKNAISSAKLAGDAVEQTRRPKQVSPLPASDVTPPPAKDEPKRRRMITLDDE